MPDFDTRTTLSTRSRAIAPERGPARRRDRLRGMSYAEGKSALQPDKPTIGELAAGFTKSMDERQSTQIDERGYGDYTGNQSGEASTSDRPLKNTDCTIFVIDILAQAFEAMGQSADWTRVLRDAQRNSKGGLKGTELMKSLQTMMGWVGVFWSPDSKSGYGEDDYSTRKAQSGKGYYGIAVDSDKVVTDYAPMDEKRKKTDTLDKLRRVNFGVLCRGGGSHMGLIVKGQVYEVHWSYTSDSKDLFEATPLEDWGGGSGAIVMPADEVANWNGTKAAP